MTNTPDFPEVINYPEESPRPRTRRAVKVAALLAVVSALVLGVALGSALANSKKHPDAQPASQHPKSVYMDICAETPQAAQGRAKLLYTDPRYMAAKPVQVSDNPDQHWCVFGTSYQSDLWWVMAYIGDDNPIYRAMFAENGYDDNATRAVITYQGIPPLKFARNGWVAFITPSGGSNDEEVWSDFKAGAGAHLLMDIAKQAEK